MRLQRRGTVRRETRDYSLVSRVPKSRVKKKTMHKTSPEIAELKHRIETNLKRKMKTPNDFIFLSGAVFDRTRETMSPTTLKRLWGYLDGADQTRNSTLEILSQFLGFSGWDQFVEEINKDNGSDKVLSHHIDVKELNVGDKVKVSWRPDRRCTFRYLGEQQFEVEEAENSKLKVGNTFFCSLFILGEPLYLAQLVQGKNPPVDFVVGNRDGLCELSRI